MNSPIPSQRSPRSRSQAGGRRPASRPGPPSQMHSDCPPEPEDNNDSPTLGQRSVSLFSQNGDLLASCTQTASAFYHCTPTVLISARKYKSPGWQIALSLTTLQPAIIQPRMAQLETLEAKMASIEVSLSSTPRRRKNGSLGGVSLGSSIRSIPKEIAAKELETLRNALRDKENIIQSLRGQLTIPGLRLTSIRNGSICNNNNNNNMNANNRELSENEKKQAEERLNRLKTDIDNKRLAIKNLKMALERLDITDNIDVRIQQAELEYQLGREELNLLTLLEETRALQLCLEESNKNSLDSHTLYSCVQGEEQVILLAIETEYNAKSPKFGAGQRDSMAGLWIDWALEETGMLKNDRLAEVNGKIVLTKTRDDLTRLLSTAPDSAQIVVLRKIPKDGKTPIPIMNNASKEVAALRSELEVVRERAEEAQKTKDGLKSDNIRLTHRISYLEEQVSELLTRRNAPEDIRIVAKSPVVSTVKTNQNVTNINITTTQSAANGQSGSDVQVFQKGPQVTALVANIPGLEVSKDVHTSLPIRSKSSLSNVSNTHIPAPSPQPSHCHKSHHHKHHKSSSRSSLQSSVSNQTLDQSDKITYRKHTHHHHHREKDYNSESNYGKEHGDYLKKNMENGHRYSADFTKNSFEKDIRSEIMDQSYKKATKIVHELTRSRDTTLYEKHRQKCLMASEKYNSDILRHYNARKSASVLDFRSEVHMGNKYPDSKSVEELDNIDSSQALNKKTYSKIRDARSVKSLDFDSDCNSTTNGYVSTGQKGIDYTSEPDSNRKLSHYPGYHAEFAKPRPTPPKKPLRLSLHKTQSLQSVETPPTTPNDSPKSNGISRKSCKRNHKGEIPIILHSHRNADHNGDNRETVDNKWYNNKHMVNSELENGSWC